MNGQSHISGLAAYAMSALLCLLSPSCAEDDFSSGADTPGTAGSSISFGVSSLSASRSAAETVVLATDSLMLHSDDAADSLAVSVSVTEGISFAAPSSRAAGVSTANFYDTFHVLAYHTVGNTLQSSFYMDEEVTKGASGTWSSADDYYWPDTDAEQLQFLAWAPSWAFSSPGVGSKLLAGYIVRPDVAEQKDVVVAMTESMGNTDAAVPLTFKHICTAVRFVVGKEMQIGKIKSLTLHDVKSSGSYDAVSGEWTLDDATADFSQEVNVDVFGTMGEGASIATGEQTFMMLPQTFPALAAGAKVEDGPWLEVVFYDDNIKANRTFKAPLGGTSGFEWPIGATVTYKISITPAYEIIVPVDLQDAHYISFDITANINDDGAWTLTSNLPNDVTFTDTKTILQSQGYWIEDDKGVSEISGSGSGTFTYHVYVTENVVGSTNTEDAPRDIVFSLTPDHQKYPDAKPVTATVTQLNPSWSAGKNVGYERIEENNGGSYPFGFKWDRKVVYSYEGFWAFLFKWAADAYITSETEAYLNTTWRVTSIFPPKSLTTATIDYGALTNSMNVAYSASDGLANTRDLYTYKGIGSVSEMEKTLDDLTIGGDSWHKKEIQGNDEYQTVLNFAVKMAVMKNKFQKEIRKETNNGETITYEVPVINKEDILWYLPASDEQKEISDETYPLSGMYWSSTALNDWSNAYQYSNGAATSSDRMNTRKIRAARRKP